MRGKKFLKKIFYSMPEGFQNFSFFIWNDLMFFRKIMSGRYSVMIETSSLCNARCIFCSNPKLKRKKSVMSDEVFNKIVERIKNENINVDVFALHLNGEPLTDPKIFERVKFLKKEFPAALVRFTSNFALATDEKIRALLDSGLDKLTISLNSLNPDEYNKIMGGGGGINFKVTYNNIENLIKERNRIKNKLKISISIVLRQDNVDEYKKFIEKFAGEAEIRAIKLGRWIGHDDIFKNAGGGEDNKKNKNFGVCGDLVNNIHFLSNGDYALCCFDPEGSINKNIFNSSIKDAVNCDYIKKLRRYQLLRGKANIECKNCSFA